MSTFFCGLVMRPVPERFSAHPPFEPHGNIKDAVKKAADVQEKTAAFPAIAHSKPYYGEVSQVALVSAGGNILLHKTFQQVSDITGTITQLNQLATVRNGVHPFMFGINTKVGFYQLAFMGGMLNCPLSPLYWYRYHGVAPVVEDIFDYVLRSDVEKDFTEPMLCRILGVPVPPTGWDADACVQAMIAYKIAKKMIPLDTL
jgi:hypothetical protein